MLNEKVNFSFETVDLSEDEEHQYLNALKIPSKKHCYWVCYYPVARDAWSRRVLETPASHIFFEIILRTFQFLRTNQGSRIVYLLFCNG